GVVSAPYSTTLQSTGGAAPIRWSIATGVLPSGLALDGASGTIAGVPAEWGTFTFAVQASDASTPSLTDTKSLTLSVAPTALAVTTVSLGSAVYQQPYQ